MNERSLKDDLLNIGYIMLWQAIGMVWGLALGRLGFHGERVFAICNVVAMTTAIAVSKGRRQHLAQVVGSARMRVAQFRRTRRDRRSRIIRAPVSRLDRIAQLVWTEKTYERVFKPARVDVLHEWQQAEAAGDHRRARFIKYLRGPLSMLSHMAAQVPVSLLKVAVDLWKG